jgi:hypothetical protein
MPANGVQFGSTMTAAGQVVPAAHLLQVPHRVVPLQPAPLLVAVSAVAQPLCCIQVGFKCCHRRV